MCIGRAATRGPDANRAFCDSWPDSLSRLSLPDDSLQSDSLWVQDLAPPPVQNLAPPPVTGDAFDQVYAFYKGQYKEYKMPQGPKLASGQQIKWAFFILDGGKDLVTS